MVQKKLLKELRSKMLTCQIMCTKNHYLSKFQNYLRGRSKSGLISHNIEISGSIYKIFRGNPRFNFKNNKNIFQNSLVLYIGEKQIN